jgi:hypothetical protein
MRRRRAKSKVKVKGRSEGHLLDQFSRASLQQWNKFSSDLDEYHIRLFYHLEGLREAHNSELIESLRTSSPGAIRTGSWCRLVSFRYSDDFLSSRGSLINGGRFNIGADLDPRRFPGFPALYIAEAQETAYAEFFGAAESDSLGGISGHEFALQSESSFSMVRLTLKIENVFDLTNTKNLHAFSKVIAKFKMTSELRGLGRAIGISSSPMLIRSPALLKKDLTSSGWRNYPVQYEIPANSQVFGRLLRDAGFEGVIYPSSKGRGKCVAVFTENLEGTDSFVELADKAPASAKHVRLDSNNWKELSSV